jgi:hypothetical protein
MGKHPLVTYIKSIFYKKIEWDKSTALITFTFSVLFYIFAIKYHSKLFLILYAISLIVFILTPLISIGIFEYKWWKEREYGKISLPKTYEDVKDKEKISYEVFEYVKGLEERIKKLEKESPGRLGIFAFFLATLLAIVLYLLPKILPH